ncbi:MAG: lysophospholipid acyltransferase family protein [Flavobacteriaceae bacterium]
MTVRSLIFNVAFYVNLVVFMLVGMPGLFSRRATWAVSLGWCHASLWLLRSICGTRVEMRGLENIPSGPLIVAAKHQSFLETFAIVTAFEKPAYILKAELKLIPVFGWYMSALGMVPVRRGKRSQAMRAMNEAATKHLDDGGQILIFVEGTRRPPGAEPQYKIGVTYMYEQNTVPCLPVALNTGLFWPRRKFMRYPGTAVIEFLPAIPPRAERGELLDTLQNGIESACDRLLVEAVRNDPELPLNPEAEARLAALGEAC